MRIIGEFPHPHLKITFFKHDDKLSIKVEDQLYEQTYKFRAGINMEGEADLRRFLDEDCLKEIEKLFEQMRRIKSAAQTRTIAEVNENWPNII